MARNLLQNHVSSSHILDDNMDFIVKHLDGKVIINDQKIFIIK